jgi:quercetin dioxygenase-like cupin family protein
MKSFALFSAAVFACLVSFSAGHCADYRSGVSASIVKKSGVTDNGRKIFYPATDHPEVTAVTVDIAPGAETGWHSHTTPVYAYVISGILTVELENGRTTVYRKGDAIFEVVDTLHNGKNLGAEPVKLAVFYTGIEGTPNVKKATQPHHAGEGAQR